MYFLFAEELSDDYAVVPGDSFPATGNHLVAISMNDIDEETSEDEQELLKRLVFRRILVTFMCKSPEWNWVSNQG